MPSKKAPTDSEKLDGVVANARQGREQREQDYRSRALRMYPWICGRCGREFTRENLHELTVHHRDHDHDNNPPDGSNWELLCLYCHDHEHSRFLEAAAYGGGATPGGEREPPSTYRPFTGLEGLLKSKK